MNVFLLGCLFVVVIPLAEGVLFALLLREVYVRHPLPLGGTIVPMWWNPPKPAAIATESAEAPEASTESAESASVEATDTGGSPEALALQGTPPEDAAVAETPVEQGEPTHSGVSVFDGTENIPEGLSVNNVLNAMTTESPAVNLDNLERIIDESAQTGTVILEEVQSIVDDMNQDDLQALANALPGTKIDFSQELDEDAEDVQMEMSVAKDVLGEDFDFDALEKQSQQAKQSFKFLASAGNGNESADFAEIPLDVREDESGTVQVSSSFVVNTVPQLAGLTTPQTIVSFFSNDWIQESSGMAESSEADTAKFCFTEESRPMFERKIRKQG